MLQSKKKSLVAVIAPSSKCSRAEYLLNEAIELLASNDFITTFNKDIFSNNTLPFFSASKEFRVKGLYDALISEDIKIIWCFRGGSGATEIVFDIMNQLSASGIKSPKILIGYSDITALHILLNQHYNIPSLHAPVLTSLLTSQKNELNNIIDCIIGKNIQFTLQKTNSCNITKVDGKIIGGNLTVLCNLLGTKLHPITKSKILLLEDVDEKSYSIYRSLLHLYNAGVLSNASAVILGDFIKSDEYLESTIQEFINTYLQNIPVYKIHGIGHGSINNPIILGSYASIDNNILNIKNPF